MLVLSTTSKKCQDCNQYKHTVTEYPFFWLLPWQPHNPYASTNTPNNSSWLLDCRASHHVATNFSNLSIKIPYDSSDEIMIGDGMGLPINHTVSTSLSILLLFIKMTKGPFKFITIDLYSQLVVEKIDIGVSLAIILTSICTNWLLSSFNFQ